MRHHPRPLHIERLVAGELLDDEAEACLRHLARCEPCLEIAEAAWSGRLSTLIKDEGEQLIMAEATAQDIERRLFHRIRVAGTGSQVAWLLTDGFPRVLAVLLRPIVAPKRSLDRRGVRP